MEMRLSDWRKRHADWARSMAEEYRRDANNTSSDYWRSKWLMDAQKMEDEADWAENSRRYMQ